MSGCGQTNREDRRPVAHARGRDDRDQADCEQKHPALPRPRNAPPATSEISGDPSTEDAEHCDDGVNRDQMSPAILDVEPACGLEVIRQPEEEEPPYRIGDELRHDEGPRLPLAQRSEPAHGTTVGRFPIIVAFDQFPLDWRHALPALGSIVERHPEGEPEEARQSGEDERPTPSETVGDEWY